jgi:hypothetical protein
MKQEYDFTNAERGKFFRDNTKPNLPVYLDEDVRTYLHERATSKGSKSPNSSMRCSSKTSS